MSEETIIRKRCCSYCHQSDGHNRRSCTKRIHDENEVLYERHRKKTEEVRKRLSVVELESRITELSEDIGEYKEKMLREKQIIGNLLYSYDHLDRKNTILQVAFEVLRVQNKELKEKKAINNNTFAVNSMKELLVKTGECCDICLEEFEIDKIEIRTCWHRCCSTCNSKLDKCHVCRE